MTTKYIVVALEDGRELIFTFPDVVMHKWMFEAAQSIREGFPGRWHRPYIGAKCVAAGFVFPDGTCYGRSESLGVDSRPSVDTKLLSIGVRHLEKTNA